MLPTFAIGLAAAALAAAQGAVSAPPGCSADYGGSFELTVALTGQNGGNVEKRGTLVVTLSGGVLTDSAGRMGEIAADRQFQFDAAPGQPDALYTDGWSLCPGGALALHGSTAFFQCLSGSFYNLYDQRVGGQCQQVQLGAVAVGAAAALSQGPDGQVQATSAKPAAALTAASQASPATLATATPATLQPVVQISDGQVQATGPAPSASAATPPGQSPTPGSTFATTFATTNGTSTRPASSSPAPSRPATVAPAAARPSSAASLVGAGAHFVAVVVAVAAAVVLV